MWLLYVLITALLGFMGLYWYITRNYNYWKSQGVPQSDGKFPWGSVMGEFIARKRNAYDIVRDHYAKFRKEPFYGSYMFSSPLFHVRDPDIIKHILVKDFNVFVNRTPFGKDHNKHATETDQLWAKQLTALTDDYWKDARATFSPIFTSGKIKAMYRAMHVVLEQLTKKVDSVIETGEDLDVLDICRKFTMDTISTCTYSLNSGALMAVKGQESEIEKQGRALFEVSTGEFILRLMTLIPGMMRLYGLLNISVSKPKATRFFYSVLKQSIKHRRQTSQKVNDMIDLMIKALQEDSSVPKPEDDENAVDLFDKDVKLDHRANKSTLDEDSVIANAMVMLLAGFDTTATTLSLAVWELVRNPDCYEALQAELEELQAKEGDTPSYTSLQGLPYLDMVVCETLRKWPQAPSMTRAPNEDYKVPGTSLTLKKGTWVFFDVSGIHNDPDIYPEPEVFNPLRFTKEEKQKRSPYHFLTFGHGPRACIGMRFALLEMKAALFTLLTTFHLERTDKTPEKLTLDPTSQFTVPLEKLVIRAKRK